MDESERIQRIMEAERATEPEARFLYHLDRAREAWWEAAGARKEEEAGANLSETVRFNTNFYNLEQMAYAKIHMREHPGEEDSS